MIVVTLSLLSVSVFSQENPQANGYKPEVGQEGKDVVWVPTPQALVEMMLNLAKITTEDFLIDLGSGDGRTVITAAKRGINALGIEYNPDMVKLSRENAAKEGVSEKAKFTEADLFEFDFTKATVITMFLLPDINIRLRPTILNLKPGTRIVSNTFTMEDWMHDDSVHIPEITARWNTAFLWIVPARAEGNWKLADAELIIHQEFQMIHGNIRNGTKSVEISSGRIRGNEITFTTGDEVYTGIINSDTMEGTVVSSGNSNNWKATR
jgi:SAM-dependent methyltransferase